MDAELDVDGKQERKMEEGEWFEQVHQGTCWDKDVRLVAVYVADWL